MNVVAGVGNNPTGGRGGVVQIDGGLAQGDEECDLKEYICAGIAIDVAVYEARAYTILPFSVYLEVLNVSFSFRGGFR